MSMASFHDIVSVRVLNGLVVWHMRCYQAPQGKVMFTKVVLQVLLRALNAIEGSSVL